MLLVNQQLRMKRDWVLLNNKGLLNNKIPFFSKIFKQRIINQDIIVYFYFF